MPTLAGLSGLLCRHTLTGIWGRASHAGRCRLQYLEALTSTSKECSVVLTGRSGLHVRSAPQARHTLTAALQHPALLQHPLAVPWCLLWHAPAIIVEAAKQHEHVAVGHHAMPRAGLGAAFRGQLLPGQGVKVEPPQVAVVPEVLLQRTRAARVFRLSLHRSTRAVSGRHWSQHEGMRLPAADL